MTDTTISIIVGTISICFTIIYGLGTIERAIKGFKIKIINNTKENEK